MNLRDTFSNREMAAGLWLLFFFFVAMISRSIRLSLLHLIHIFCARKILIVVSCMLAYVLGIILLLRQVGLWHVADLKDTVIWTMSIGFMLIVRVATNYEEGFFKAMLLDNLKVMILVEFLVNLYSFPFWIEIILLPGLLFVVLLQAQGELNPENQPVVKIMEFLLGVYGVAVLSFSLFQVVSHFSEVATLESLRVFLLPILMSILYTPFIYCVAIVTKYENVFVQISIMNFNDALAAQFKKAVVLKSGLGLRTLSKWAHQVGSLHVDNQSDIKSLLSKVEGKNECGLTDVDSP